MILGKLKESREKSIGSLQRAVRPPPGLPGRFAVGVELLEARHARVSPAQKVAIIWENTVVTLFPNDKGKSTQTPLAQNVADFLGAERAVWGRYLPAG